MFNELMTQDTRVLQYDSRTKSVGFGSKEHPRTVPLSAAAAVLFDRLVKDKLPYAYIFTRDNGHPWAHSDWDELIRDAAEKAGLPKGVCLYTLRHSFHYPIADGRDGNPGRSANHWNVARDDRKALRTSGDGCRANATRIGPIDLVAGRHIALEFGSSDIGPGTVFLNPDQTVPHSVIKLRPTHTQHSRGFVNLKTQRRLLRNRLRGQYAVGSRRIWATISAKGLALSVGR